MYEYDEYNPKKRKMNMKKQSRNPLTIPQTAWKTNPM